MTTLTKLLRALFWTYGTDADPAMMTHEQRGAYLIGLHVRMATDKSLH